jgi:hypothetical protein
MNDNAASTVVIDDSGNGKNGTAMQNTSILHTAGKINGALTFNGTTDYVNVGNVVGTGAYTKVAWVKRDAGNYFNNIISSDNLSHALYAPSSQSFKLSAGHADPYTQVQDPTPLDVNVWYFVAVTFDPAVSSGRMVLYKNGQKVSEASSVPTQSASTATYIGRFYTGYSFKGAIDDVMMFNRALTADEITTLYNQGNGTEVISGSPADASYSANGWSMDTAQDLAVSINYHYTGLSLDEGWTGITVGDDVNYVSISAGSNNNTAYFYYEAVVNGNVVFEQEPRTSNDGTLYVSFDSASKKFYLSHTGFGSGNAYSWQATNPTYGPWSQPVKATLEGGSAGATLAAGQAYLDNFQTNTAALLNWPPVTDLDHDGYIDAYDLAIMADSWLNAGPGDFDNNNRVDFVDYAQLALAW